MNMISGMNIHSFITGSHDLECRLTSVMAITRDGNNQLVSYDYVILLGT